MSKDRFDPDISHHYEIVDLESIIDKDAHMNGFDKDGYDKMGYDKSGYDKNDFDFEGYHRVTDTKFNYYNIDKRGFNDTGIHGVTGTKFDENDFDVDSIHKVTGTLYDEDGYDVGGFDKSGYDKEGFGEHGYDKDGVDRNGSSVYEEWDNEWDNTDSTDPVFKNDSTDPYEDKEYIKEQFGTGKPFDPNDDEGDEEIRE